LVNDNRKFCNQHPPLLIYFVETPEKTNTLKEAQNHEHHRRGPAVFETSIQQAVSRRLPAVCSRCCLRPGLRTCRPYQDQARRKLRRKPSKARHTRNRPPEQLQQLVAPIALYIRIPSWHKSWRLPPFPNKSSKPTDGVQAHPDLKGDALGQAVDQQTLGPER